MRLLRAALCLLLLAGAGGVWAALVFPTLSGRVVDGAGLLDTATRAQLEQLLKGHEQSTGEQVVVVTLASLQGQSIEDYGYQLGRHWGIGQQGKDNGALLIVAPQERKLRIEVGYGLEGRLTDAQASVIINQVITPAFKSGDYAQGISEGVAAILQVLGGEPMVEVERADGAKEEQPPALLFFVLMMVVMGLIGGGGGRGRRGAMAAGLLGASLGRGGSCPAPPPARTRPAPCCGRC